ncbi:MAG TPA: hypothetical protein VFW82_00575 [Dyella sp.]|nr:hypothetical protein [Dyella sp.]
MNGKGKIAALGLMMASALSLPLSASADGWGRHGGYHGGGHHGGYHGGYGGGYGGGYHGGYGGGYGRGHGGYHHGGHWSGGRWIAGAIVAGAVIGLVDAAVNPRPDYYERPVVYARPRTVIYYEDRPVVERRVVETRTVVYDNGYPTRYVRDDGYYGN